MTINTKKWLLKKRPEGLVKNTDFQLVDEALPELKEGEILIQNEYLSVDPTQRMWLNDAPGSCLQSKLMKSFALEEWGE